MRGIGKGLASIATTRIYDRGKTRLADSPTFEDESVHCTQANPAVGLSLPWLMTLALAIRHLIHSA
jgi:hypothetical protein